VVRAPDRESLVQRTRALDRVLLWKHLVIPQWHIQSARVLWWDKFARPDTAHIAKDGVNIDRWWYVPAKAEELAARERANPGLLDAGVEGAGSGDTPGWGTTLLAFAAVALVGWFVFRSALRRRAA
jgi:microcin C transport system substrate-binding protein